MDAVVLLDGGFLKRKYRSFAKKDISATEVESIAKNVIASMTFSCKSYRVYYYDCPPNGDTVNLRISSAKQDFSKNPQYKRLSDLLQDLKHLDNFAVREGTLSFEGWRLKDSLVDKNGSVQTPQLKDDDFLPVLKQKGVDMKIGLDMAWVSYEHIAEHIILITGDSDFSPAVKTARRKGVFVHLFTLGHGVKNVLRDNVDTLDARPISAFLQ